MQNRKPFLSIDEQMRLLRSRGMRVGEGDRLTLMREGYYSVVNGYKDAFIDRQATSEAGDDRYRNGTSFEHVHLLFDLDRDLREVTFPLLVRAETTVRTALAYSYSERHREPDAYLDPDNYCSPRQYHNRGRYDRDKADLLRYLKDAHDNRWRQPSIDHYLSRHGHIPLWVLVNVLTFGNISHMYAMSQMPVRNAVCRMIAEEQGRGRIAANQLRKTVATLVDFRNVCAHDDRLYCARLGKHRDKSFADMVEALALIVDAHDVERYRASVTKAIRAFDRVPSIQNEALRGMSMRLENGSLVDNRRGADEG